MQGQASSKAALSRVSTLRIPGATNVFKAVVDSRDRIHVVFDSDNGPYYTMSASSAAPFSKPMPVLPDPVAPEGLRFQAWDLAVSDSGAVFVALGNNAWKLKLPQEQWGYFLSTLRPGEGRFSGPRNLNHKPSEGFSIAAGPDGVLVASFLADKLFTMISKDDGRTFGAFAEPDPSFNPCNCCTVSTSFGRDGRLALLYREETNNDRDMHLALWEPTKKAKPTRHLVSRESWKVEACPMTYFSVVPSGVGYVAAWPTKGRIYFTRIDSNGAASASGEVRTPGISGMRTGLMALPAADGTVLVAWKNRDVLRWQLYDVTDKPQGGVGEEPSSGSGAAGVVLRDGRFVLFP